MVHIDCRYLAKDIVGVKECLYLAAIIDDYGRLVWVEAVPQYQNIKALTVMFAAMRILNYFRQTQHIKFKEILSNNGVEFGGKNLKNSLEHPFERMLIEMGIKYKYTGSYRSQTNGKIERFWKKIGRAHV